MDIGYERGSTAKQDLVRRWDALAAAGINSKTFSWTRSQGPPLPGSRSHSGTQRPATSSLFTPWTGSAEPSGTLNLAHELQERGVSVRTLADPSTPHRHWLAASVGSQTVCSVSRGWFTCWGAVVLLGDHRRSNSHTSASDTSQTRQRAAQMTRPSRGRHFLLHHKIFGSVANRTAPAVWKSAAWTRA
jgi:hypothetical protein